jgi:hypothetical protein
MDAARQTLLQFMMHRHMAPEHEVLKLYAKACDATQVAVMPLDGVVAAINQHIAPFSIKIAMVQREDNAQRLWGLV